MFDPRGHRGLLSGEFSRQSNSTAEPKRCRLEGAGGTTATQPDDAKTT